MQGKGHYTARINRPFLTEEERERRVKEVIMAAERILREQRDIKEKMQEDKKDYAKD